MDYRTLHDVDVLGEIVDVEIAVWGMPPRDAVPLNVLRIVPIIGGVVIGAFDDDKIVGLTVGLPSRRHSTPTLWSHMAGVLPEYRSMRIGFQLKQRQREWALENGYEVIRWTFDPMQSGNANFNLSYLGVSTCILHHNFYGAMHDEINVGMPTDRLEVEWQLNSPRVVELARTNGVPLNAPTASTIDTIPPLLENTPNGLVTSPYGAHECYRVEIPQDVNRLKHQNFPLVVEWSAALRQVLGACFDHGCVIRSFAKLNGRTWYIIFTN